MFKIILSSILILIMISCNKIKDKTKETINKSGEKIGQGASEFFEGMADGVEKTLRCNLEVSENLKSKGLEIGNYNITDSDSGGTNNKLNAYIIFNKNFSDTVFAKAFNKDNLETGRSNIILEGKKGDAKYVDFNFQKLSNIGTKSKVILN